MKNQRLYSLKQIITKKEISAILITNAFNRRYYSGFTGTSGYLLITSDENYFITDSRYTEQAMNQTDGFNILKVEKSYNDFLIEIINDLNLKTVGFEDYDVTVSEYNELSVSEAELVPLNKEDFKSRVIKDEKEIESIATACKLADDAFYNILKYIKVGISEKDIALELEFHMRKNGAEAKAFDFVVASGKRSCMPHGVASNKLIEANDIITMDFGCVYKGYNSDTTRTIFVGEATEKMKEVYNIVLQAQIKGLEGIQESIEGKAVDKISRKYIEDKGYGEFFGHGLGHGVGLEIHEAPTLSTLSKSILKEGMVVTVEPGIYIPNEFGVRIEDTVVIKNGKALRLTTSDKNLIVI